MSHKIAIFIYEPITSDLSRVYRGLNTALEFQKAGDDVAVVFDGSGVESLAAISDASHKMNPMLHALHPVVHGACAGCAASHSVKDEISAAGFTLLDENRGEASVRKYVVEGYTILSF